MNTVGLSDNEVLQSRNLYGSNILTPPKRDPWYILLLEKFKDPLIEILCVAAIIALILGIIKLEFEEPIGIILAICLAVGMGFLNEWSAAKKFDIMNQVSDDILVKVRRSGHVTQIPRKDLVVGDIVILESGEEIPADIKILESHNLRINESALTGESKAVIKMSITEGENNGTYPSDMVLRGTTIEEGTATGVVTAVGDKTEIGKTARQAAEITDVTTPLNKQLNGLAELINKIAYGAATFLIISLLVKYFFIEKGYIGQDWMQIANDMLSCLMIAVALIVVAVPEGLPMAVTLALAYSMKRMSRANNLVRKMHACETLGATTLILTDKTGTLTQNKMKVVDSNITDDSYLKYNILGNSTAFIEGDKTIGNPTEGALIRHLNVSQAGVDILREECKPVYREEFSSKSKYMLTVIMRGDRYIGLIKGAPEVVEGFCTEVPLDVDATTQQYRGRRVIGFAFKVTDTLEDAASLTGYNYNGYMAIEDPIRPDVPEAIRAAKKAGIKVKIITGDNPTTAIEIARQAGLSDSPQGMAGIDMRNKSNPYDSVTGISTIDVFARTKPEDKQTLVTEFQALGEVVAMTGDGTNDAPALNHAEVGIAMNNGTDVAKEAADIILLDNSFPSIILGVKWGRSLYKNIQHFILFQLTINVVAILIACVGPFIGVNLPFTVVQMLWVNLIMDTFAALALATEPANDAVMEEAPRDPKAFIITKNMWWEILGKGLIFFLFLTWLLIGEKVSLSYFFTIFVLLQWWNLFNARVFGQKRSIFDGLLKNPAFIGISLAILVGQFLIVQFGGDMFRTEPIPLNHWGLLIAGTSVVAIFRELKYQISKIF